jgi:hypothetical protein
MKEIWDYSIYPELKSYQNDILKILGETLYFIQLAESGIKNSSKFLIQKNLEKTLNEFYKKDVNKNKTLGRLIKEVSKNIVLHDKLLLLLERFRNNRNLFIHNLFESENYKIATEEDCKKLEAFCMELQDDAWNINQIFLSALIKWAKENNIYEQLPESFKNNKHLQQLEKKDFFRLVGKNDKSIDIINVQHKPN